MRQLDIFRFWLPLFASWLLMLAEGPLVSAAVNRLPDEVVMLAAFGLVVSLAVLIESPVINLLATATALVQDRASYELVRRFAVHWAVALTVVQALVAFTPLFDLLVLQVLAIPEEVARWMRPALMIMVPWSAAIAWRRFLQGVLIHAGRTRLVAWGTAVRLTAVVVTAGGLLAWERWPGAYLGAVCLMVGVFAEAIFATLAARPVVRALSRPADLRGGRQIEPRAAVPGAPRSSPTPGPESPAPLTYRAVAAYHLPLASTAALTLLTQPLASFSLARLAEPTLSLAAWPMVLFLTLILRAGALALPEVIIALHRSDADHAPLRRFSLTLTAGGLLAMASVALTPLADLYLIGLQSTTAEVAALARRGLWILLPMPAIVTLICWLRGYLMSQRSTGLVNVAMGVRLAVFVAVLGIGLGLSWPGVPTAAWAVNLSVLTELAYLAWKVERPRADG